jgi:hypothetical protein
MNEMTPRRAALWAAEDGRPILNLHWYKSPEGCKGKGNTILV